MKANKTTWLAIFTVIYLATITNLINNQDISIIALAICATILRHKNKKESIEFNRDVATLLNIVIFTILASYRIMFDFIEVQSYITNEPNIRERTITTGALIMKIFTLGCLSVHINNKNKLEKGDSLPLSKKITFTDTFNLNTLLLIGIIPLLLNAVVYLIYFSGKSYADLYTSTSGFEFYLLKSIYITYAAIILIATNNTSSKNALRNQQYLLASFFLVYGLLFNMRSPVLASALLYYYFYGQKLGITRIFLYLSTLIIIFFLIGTYRESSQLESSLAIGLLTTLISLGEFADSLAYAIAETDTSAPMFGVGILGSFLGFAEPVANSYARLIAPDYFDAGGGFGFFILADLVINFGIRGSLIIVFLMGFFITKINMSKIKYRNYIFCAILFSNVFALTRNDLGSTFRGVVYTIIFLILITCTYKFIAYLSSNNERITIRSI